MSWKEASTASKFLIAFTAIFLISFGLCGLTMVGRMGDMQLGIVELLLMIVSFAGVVITLLVALVQTTIEDRRNRPQSLFDDSHEKK